MTPPGRNWVPVAAFATLALAVVAVSWPTWASLWRSWRGPDGASHGFLVAPLAVWLAWRALTAPNAPPARPGWWLLLPTAAVSFLCVFFRAATVSVLEQGAAAILVWIAATALLGWRTGRALLFPIWYLFVAIPIWEALVPVLQPLTTAAAGSASQLIGIPTYIEGNIVHIPEGVFEIEEGCAGLRYFVSAIAIAALYAHLEYRRWSSWAALIGLAAALSIVGNWIRVVIVIYTGHTAGMQHPWVKDHASIGWVVFAFTLIPLFALTRRLDAREAREPRAQVDAIESTGRPPAALAGALVATVLAAGVPQAFWRAPGTADAPSSPQSLAAPDGQHGWRGPLPADADWRPACAPPDGELLASYEDGQTRVTVFGAFYKTQSQGREVVGYDTRIEGEAWTTAEEDRVTDRESGEWRRAVLVKRGGRRRVVLYRYRVGGHPTASRLEAKLRQGLSPFTSDPSAALFAASAPCPDSCEQAEAGLTGFLKAMQAVDPAQLPR